MPLWWRKSPSDAIPAGDFRRQAARDVIADAGYRENFGHSLGHGVGFAVHEIPRVSPRSTDPLDVNSVFTVEPGIHLSGWGGVRIEDIVILGENGATPLSKASK